MVFALVFMLGLMFCFSLLCWWNILCCVCCLFLIVVCSFAGVCCLLYVVCLDDCLWSLELIRCLCAWVFVNVEYLLDLECWIIVVFVLVVFVLGVLLFIV